MSKTKISSSENYVNPFETGYAETGIHDFTKIKNSNLRDEYSGNRAEKTQFVNINSSEEEKQVKIL